MQLIFDVDGRIRAGDRSAYWLQKFLFIDVHSYSTNLTVTFEQRKRRRHYTTLLVFWRLGQVLRVLW